MDNLKTLYEPIQSKLKQYTNNTVIQIIIGCLVFYTVFLTDKLPLCLNSLVDNSFFKSFLLMLILAYVDIKPELSVMIVVAYVVSIVMLTKKNSSEGFYNIEKFTTIKSSQDEFKKEDVEFTTTSDNSSDDTTPSLNYSNNSTTSSYI